MPEHAEMREMKAGAKIKEKSRVFLHRKNMQTKKKEDKGYVFHQNNISFCNKEILFDTDTYLHSAKMLRE